MDETGMGGAGMDDAAASDVALIGVGRMGAAAVRALAAAGHGVQCFDVSREATDRVADVATPRISVADAAAGAGLVLLSLRGPDDVTEVTREIRDAARSGTVVVDMSTIDPSTARAAAALLAQGGVDYLDAPVLGRPERVGAWTIPCGGDAAVVGRVAPILEGSIAARVVHVGATGAGSVLKLMNNLMLGAINAITAEALAVCSAAGLDPGVFVDVVADSGAASVSPMFRDIGPKIVAGDFGPTFTVELMHKDNALAVQLAEQVGVPLVVGEAVHQLNTRALERYRHDDSSAVVKLFEEATGIPARRA
jgi:3-hydroxyisobutyrate dehydrogenase-like beta-hydroxyacid dehydrogenase